jgi:predicted ATP-dependent endonuclease of OLD family
MINKIGIQNFRVFGDEVSQFKLAPITVLTGCNSSGKSSVIKSMMLLKNYLKDFKDDYLKNEMRPISSYPLEFNQGIHKLARFNKSLNRYSNHDEMVFSWAKYSLFANKEIQIELTFIENKENILGNGILDRLKVLSEGEKLFTFNFNSKKNDMDGAFSINHHAFKKLYFDFVGNTTDEAFLLKGLKENDNPFVSKMVRDNTLFKLLFKNSQAYYKTNELNKLNLLDESNKDNRTLINSPAYKYIKDATKDDLQELTKLFSLLAETNNENKTIFYTPGYGYLKDATKDNINQLIFDKIQDVKGNEKLLVLLKDVVSSFEKSKHQSFKEFFADIEDAYLTERYSGEKDLCIISPAIPEASSSSFLSAAISELQLFDPEGGYTHFDIGYLNSNDSIINFEHLCVVMYEFSKFINPNYTKNNIIVHDKVEFDGESHFQIYKEYLALKEHASWLKYIDIFLNDAIFNLPVFVENVEFINTDRPKVERIYNLGTQKGSFGDLLNDYVSMPQNNIPISSGGNYKIGDFLRRWVKEFEIADDVIFENTKEGAGMFIYFINQGEKILLADLGYGITQVVSMLMKIELSILNNLKLSKYLSIVSLKCLRKYYDNELQTLSIEEPEANLHPKFQSKLADMFMETNEQYNINFILETHSEYLIRKLQYLVAVKKINSDKIVIHYLNEPDILQRSGDKSQVVELNIQNDGSLDGEFGSGFFDEATNWKVELMRIKHNQKN